MSRPKPLSTVVIVDAYSSGNLLAPVFQKMGFDCVHVQSATSIFPPLLATFNPDHFSAQILHRDSLQDTLREVQKIRPVAVLTGSETGVILADWLSENMNLKTNGSKLSQCRRDKFAMAEQIRSQGLRAVRQFKTNSLTETLKWIQQSQTPWPLVIKPLHSAASDGVFLIHNNTELEKTFNLLCGKMNKLGLHNEELLIQEFLQGPEYIFDSVSCDGKHFMTDIWESHKISVPFGNGDGFLYNFQSLLPAESPRTNEIKKYCSDVLDALGIRHGPAHAEVITTPNGPILVEIAARLAGTMIPMIAGHCTGLNPVELVADAYCDPQRFSQKTIKPYSLLKHGRLLYLRSHKEGIMKCFSAQEQVKNLESFHRLRMLASVGEKIAKTVDLNTVTGILELVNTNCEALDRDHVAFNEMQERGLFEIVETL